MKVLCVGDSWSAGYGIDPNESWPCVLSSRYNLNLNNASCSGSDNKSIAETTVDELDKNKYDLVIVGWSGVTRYTFDDKSFDFCSGDPIKTRDIFFKNKSLKNIEEDFLGYQSKIRQKCNKTKLVEFSVFGDFKHLYGNNFIKTSFLDFLAKAQGDNFVYNIPFFEFGFLSEINHKNTSRFARKYFPKNWKKAIVERENIIPGKYFLDCGHPNAKGNELWASYLGEFIFD